MMSNSQDPTSAKVDLRTPSKALEKIFTRLRNPAEKKSDSNLKSLAKNPAILARLEKYAEDPLNEHRITVRSFSRVKEDDIFNMGVTIHPDISPQSFLPYIQPLLHRYELDEIITTVCSTPFFQSAGDRAFESLAESRARIGIHQLMSEIINALQARQVFLVEDHVVIARLGSKVPPVELQYKSDGIIQSYFLTGVLDFLCCSLDLNKRPLYMKSKALKAWGSRSVAPPNKSWKNIDTFLDYLAQRAQVFDSTSSKSKSTSQWQLLVIEAKARDAPYISQPGIVFPRDQNHQRDVDFRVQNLFLLDPTRWLLAHDNLKSLLPSDDGKPSTPLHDEVLDRYLFVIWHSLKNKGCRARYIPFHFLKEDSQPDQNQIQSFRQISGLHPPPERCPLESVVGVICHEEQHFVVVVPHVTGQEEEEKWIYILGETTSFDRYSDTCPLGEGGWTRLMNIGYYHGWDIESYNVCHIGWDQDHGNSGPIACEVVKAIFKDGFSIKRAIPTYWCAHDSCLDILNTVHTSAIRHLGRFYGIHEGQGATPEYIAYFSSRLEGIKKQLEIFWANIDDPNSQSGFSPTSKRLVESTAQCIHCAIAFACHDLGIDDNVDDSDEREMQEVEAQVFENPVCDLPDHSLADQVHKLNISDASSKPITPQPAQEQRSLKQYVFQAIAECLALHSAPKPEKFQENILKFCVSSGEDWIFGVIDCTREDENHHSCYITDTVTYKFEGENDPTKFNNIITLLVIWMCVPAAEILPQMKQCL